MHGKSVRLLKEEIEKDFGAHGLEKSLELNDVDLELESPLGQITPIEGKYHKLNYIFLEKKERENVIKVFPETRFNVRREEEIWKHSNNPANNYVNGAYENRDLFPDSKKIGRGTLYTDDGEFGLEILRQEYIPHVEENLFRNIIEEGEYSKKILERVLEKWNTLIDRHRTNLTQEDIRLKKMIRKGNNKVLKEIRNKYHERFPSLQFEYIVRELERQYEIEFGDLENGKIEKSKILGDFAPRQILVPGRYLSFDLERYGSGEPGKDLSFLLETVERKIGRKMAEKIAEDMVSILQDPDLLKKLKKNIIGYRGEKLLFGLDRKRERNLSLLKSDIEFYEDLGV